MQSKKDSLLNIIQNSSYSESKYETYKELGKLYSLKGKYDQAIIVFKEGLYREKTSIPANDKVAFFQEISMAYLNKKVLDSAQLYIEKAEYIYENNKDGQITNAPYNLKSIISRKLGNYPLAVKYSLKSIDVFLKNKEFIKASASYNSLGLFTKKRMNMRKPN